MKRNVLRSGQLAKAEVPILTTLAGMVILVRPLLPWKDRSSMLVTLEGMVTVVMAAGHACRLVLLLLKRTPSTLA